VVSAEICGLLQYTLELTVYNKNKNKCNCFQWRCEAFENQTILVHVKILRDSLMRFCGMFFGVIRFI
jgi:hypothetical protein